MLLLTALVLNVHAGQLAGAVHGANGQVIVGAEVLAINSRMQAAVAQTDQNGHYRFQGLPDGQYRLLATPQSGDPHVPRYFPDVRDFCEGTLVSTGSSSLDTDIELPTGRSLSGRIMDVDGVPLEDVRVKVNSESGHHDRDGRTDGDGRFTITGLEDSGDWSVSAFVSGYPLQWYGQSYAVDNSTLVTTPDVDDLGDWTLLDGIGVSGLVEGPAGPISDALVRVYSGGQVSQTSTDATGNYEALGLPPGDVMSWAAADGYATTYLPDEDRPTTSVSVTEEGEWRDGLDITMPEEAVLAVQLTGDAPRTQGDLSGLPLVLYNDTQSVGRAAQTDRDGLAAFSGLHPGKYTLYVYGGDAGHGDDWIRDPAGDIMTISLDEEGQDEVLTLPLASAVTVAGSVVDDHGFPIPGAAVILNDASSEDEDELNTFFLTATADENGRFEVVGVPPGAWTVTALSQSLCLSDPGHVTVYWPHAVDAVMAERLTTSLDTPVVSLHFTLPRDHDHDAMGDRWERRYGLDTNRDDAAEDPDDDGLTNLMEFRLRTNPNAPEGEWVVQQNCGCATTPQRGTVWLYLGLAGAVGFRRRSAEASQRRPARLVR